MNSVMHVIFIIQGHVGPLLYFFYLCNYLEKKIVSPFYVGHRIHALQCCKEEQRWRQLQKSFLEACTRRDPDVHKDPCGWAWEHEDNLQWPAITSGYMCLSLACGLDACFVFVICG